jgi:cysteinyl-tRNA synthetase
MQPFGIPLFFDCHGHHFSRLQMARVHWGQEHWEKDIDLQLAEMAHVKHTRTSLSDFMNNIKSRKTSSNGRNEELQFITNILDANEKDSEDAYDQICHPNHLYALIQSFVCANSVKARLH